MSRSPLIAAALVSLALVGTSAFAQTPAARPQANTVAPATRLQVQARRIHRGVAVGRIDRAERIRLIRGETAIRSRLRALRQRGQPPTAEERRALIQSLNRMHRAIARAIRRGGSAGR